MKQLFEVIAFSILLLGMSYFMLKTLETSSLQDGILASIFFIVFVIYVFWYTEIREKYIIDIEE